MTIAIIVAIYILGVFAARQYNKWLYKRDKELGIAWQLWWMSWGFIIVVWIIFLSIKIQAYKIEWKDNWFTGKYWKDEK